MKNIELQNAQISTVNIAEITNTRVGDEVISVLAVFDDGIKIADITIDGKTTPIFTPTSSDISVKFDECIKKSSILSDYSAVDENDVTSVVSPKVVSQMSAEFYSQNSISSISSALEDVFLIKLAGKEELIDDHIENWGHDDVSCHYQYATTPNAVIKYVNLCAIAAEGDQLIGGSKAFGNSIAFEDGLVSKGDIEISTVVPTISFFKDRSSRQSHQVLASADEYLDVQPGINTSNLYVNGNLINLGNYQEKTDILSSQTELSAHKQSTTKIPSAAALGNLAMLNYWCGTSAAYDEIQEKDNMTIYFIKSQV